MTLPFARLILLGFFSALSLTSVAAQAAPSDWWELTPGTRYELTQTLDWGAVSLPKGARLELDLREGLAAVDVEWLQFRRLDCTDVGDETPIEIFLPQSGGESDRDRSVGASLSAGCLLEVYVETLDLMSVSFFSSLGT